MWLCSRVFDSHARSELHLARSPFLKVFLLFCSALFSADRHGSVAVTVAPPSLHASSYSSTHKQQEEHEAQRQSQVTHRNIRNHSMRRSDCCWLPHALCCSCVSCCCSSELELSSAAAAASSSSVTAAASSAALPSPSSAAAGLPCAHSCGCSLMSDSPTSWIKHACTQHACDKDGTDAICTANVSGTHAQHAARGGGADSASTHLIRCAGCGAVAALYIPFAPRSRNVLSLRISL